MNWILIEWMITVILLIIVGIPLMIAIVIPLIVYKFGSSKRFPSFEYLLEYFKVDVSQKPYCDWIQKHPLIYLSLTSIELYTSYYLIILIKGIKSIWRRLFGKSRR